MFYDRTHPATVGAATRPVDCCRSHDCRQLRRAGIVRQSGVRNPTRRRAAWSDDRSRAVSLETRNFDERGRLIEAASFFHWHSETISRPSVEQSWPGRFESTPTALTWPAELMWPTAMDTEPLPAPTPA
jgi:hypothetical protein